MKYCTPCLMFFFTQEAYEEHWHEVHGADAEDMFRDVDWGWINRAD